MLARQLGQLGMPQQRRAAQHHHAPPRPQRRLDDGRERRRRRALDHDLAHAGPAPPLRTTSMPGPGAAKPVGLAHAHRGQAHARNSLHQPRAHRAPDRPITRDPDR